MMKPHLLELHHMWLHYITWWFPFLVKLKDLVAVKFSVAGSSLRPAEEQAWVNFSDFLDECDGKLKIVDYFCL